MRGVVLCLVTVILLTVLGGCAEKPEAAAETFLECWSQEEYDEMYRLLDTASQEQYSRDYFVSRYTKISGDIGLRSVDYSAPQLLESKENSTIFSFEVTLDTYTVGPIPMHNQLILTREDKRSPWRIFWEPTLIFPELTQNRRLDLSRQVPFRGSIFDRHGLLLAGYRTFKVVGTDPGRIDDRQTLVSTVAGLLDSVTPALLESKLNQPWVREGLYVPLVILEPGQEELLPELENIQGIDIREVKRRYYPAGEALGHVVGYLGEITAEELAKQKEMGYYSGDMVGRTGLEAALDNVLGGAFGFTLRILEEDGTPAAVLATREMRAGEDITLTIDLALQRSAEEALGEKTGAVVALAPGTGEILALAVNPAFDPNWFISGLTAERWQALQDNPARPLLNRALVGLYPPGSVFKVVTAAAAVEEERLDPREIIQIEGLYWQPSLAWGNYHVERVLAEHTRLNLDEAMKYSDNIYFARAGLALGADLFEMYGRRFGFGDTIPFVLPVAVSRLARDGIKSEILLADTSFGQGEVMITPLHMALIYAAVARGGDIPSPRLLLTGEPEEVPWKESVFSPETAAIVHRSLVNAIHGDNSLAAAGAVEGVTVAGKTGTAQVDNIEGNVCWYATYAPADRPEVVVVAMVEGGTWASEEALPVARAVLEQFLERN